MVEGARRIWGTLKNFPSTAVLGAISKLTEVKDSLQIRRKFKKLTGNKMLWWFVIHCEEEILCKLDAEWEKVKFQTGWTLQKCYKPANEEEQPGTDRNTQMQSATLPESQYNLGHQADGSSTTMLDTETPIDTNSSNEVNLVQPAETVSPSNPDHQEGNSADPFLDRESPQPPTPQ